MRPRALDLFCCQGGVSAGLTAAGFDVTGVDIEPQPRYPFRFVQADALLVDLHGYDLIWASPPCQRFSVATPRANREQYPDLIDAVRTRLKAAGGVPWVIENVPGAPIRKDLTLHGRMFGLPLFRTRHFESNVLLLAPTTRPYPRDGSVEANRRRSVPTEFLSLYGNFPGVERARRVLGLPWMDQRGLAQCIPPQYAEFIGRQILGLSMRAAA